MTSAAETIVQKATALTPKDKQWEFMRALEPEVLYSGAFGAGKTRALVMKALLLAQLYPGTTIGLCRKTMTSMRMTTMESFFEVCPRECLVSWHKSEGVATVRSGPRGDQTARLFFFGLVKASGESFNTRSLNLGACGIDEVVEITENEWHELQGRTRDLRCGVNQLFAATNPANQGHWVYQRFFRNRQPGVHRVIETNMLENRENLPAAYVALHLRHTGRYFDRYVMGKWVDFEGVVYDPYDPSIHEITWQQFAERFGQPSIPDAWRRVGAVDFGFHNPFVFHWWAQSPDAEWFRYREIYMTRRTVRAHCGQIKDFPDTEQLECVYADHDAEDRATMAEEGIDTVPANKEKSPGIQTLYNELVPDAETGRPRCFFLREALVEQDASLELAHKPMRTEEEFGGYCYPPGTDRLNPKEEPIKLNDHGLDAARYRAHTEAMGAGDGAGMLAWVRQQYEAKVRREAGEANGRPHA